MEFFDSDSWVLDRKITFNNIVYKIVAILNCEMLLVIKKEDFDLKKFPLQTYVIPGH
jgi:hypothetical protein